MRYKCKICGYIYDNNKEEMKFNDVPNTWVCPLCGSKQDSFEELDETKIKTPELINDIPTEIIDMDERVLYNATKISIENLAIKRIISRCVDCGICKAECIKQEGFSYDENSDMCLNCGQCVQSCPMRAIVPKSGLERLKAALKTKVCIAYTSPAVRVSIGEIFGKEPGSFEQSKLIGLLRMLGFKYVLDTSFGADLTVMEEATEFVSRIKNKKNLPQLTSCCPAWVKYAEIFYPELIPNLSTCKSPIGMQGIMVKEYFSKKMNLDKNDIYDVAITPCTAKKAEITLYEGTDLVLTLLEIQDLIREKKIKYEDIPDSTYDSIFGEGSGAGVIFGKTGGVMTAAIRTAYHNITGKDLKSDVVFTKLNDNVSEGTLYINDEVISLCVIHEMSQAKKILEDVKKGISKYQFIEIMNCRGGCIGGGGQPVIRNNDYSKKEKRIDSLTKRDKNALVHYSYANPDIINIYKEYLSHPCSDLAESLLHTSYTDKSSLK